MGLHIHLGCGLVARARCLVRLVRTSGVVGGRNEERIHNSRAAPGPNNWCSRAAREATRAAPWRLDWRGETEGGMGRQGVSSRSGRGRPRRSRQSGTRTRRCVNHVAIAPAPCNCPSTAHSRCRRRRCRNLADPKSPLQHIAKRTLATANLARRKTSQLGPGPVGVGTILHELGCKNQAREERPTRAAERRRKNWERREGLILRVAGCSSRERGFDIDIAYQDGVSNTDRLDCRRAGGLVAGGRRTGRIVADFNLENTLNDSRLRRFRALSRRAGPLRPEKFRNLRPDCFKIT